MRCIGKPEHRCCTRQQSYDALCPARLRCGGAHATDVTRCDAQTTFHDDDEEETLPSTVVTRPPKKSHRESNPGDTGGNPVRRVLRDNNGDQREEDRSHRCFNRSFRAHHQETTFPTPIPSRFVPRGLLLSVFFLLLSRTSAFSLAR